MLFGLKNAGATY
jgi:hypothetical protein